MSEHPHYQRSDSRGRKKKITSVRVSKWQAGDLGSGLGREWEVDDEGRLVPTNRSITERILRADKQ